MPLTEHGIVRGRQASVISGLHAASTRLNAISGRNRLLKPNTGIVNRCKAMITRKRYDVLPAGQKERRPNLEMPEKRRPAADDDELQHHKTAAEMKRLQRPSKRYRTTAQRAEARPSTDRAGAVVMKES